MSAAVSASRCWAVIPAAGSGQRMACARPKQYLPLAGASVIEHALAAFLEHPRIAGVVVALAADDAEFQQLSCSRHPRVSTAVGGAERAHSVLKALEALSGRAADSDWIVVHDAARPCLTRADLDRLMQALIDDPVGGLFAVPAGDTLKREDAQDSRAAGTLDRAGVWRAQTPQMFRFEQLRAAIRQALVRGIALPDDASAIEALGLKPRLVPGPAHNLKITQPDDLEMAAVILARRHKGAAMSVATQVAIKVGIGFDAHAFGAGNHVMLGGVRIAHSRSVVAHSDGDVLIHALCDALLGAAGLGDIGQHFPDSDPRWRGAASSLFLERVVQMLAERGLRPINVDLTLLAEEPKLSPHRESIRHTLAGLLRLPADAVNLKATTLERMGFIGRGEGLAAQAIAAVQAIATVAEKGSISETVSFSDPRSGL